MTASRAYAAAQTVILFAFAAVFFWAPGAVLIESSAVRIAGQVLAIAGVALVLVAVVTLRAVIQVEPAPRADAWLVTRGIYRYLRHPIYTGMLVVTIGLLLMKPTVAVAIAGVVFIAFLVAKTRFEEKLLMQRYPAYSDYRRRAWGLVPGL